MKANIFPKLNKKIKLILPLFHFLLTFFFERKTFLFSHNFDVLSTQHLSNFFSDTFELVMTYTITKFLALIMIVLLWKLFFAILEKAIPLKSTIIFSTLFIVGLIVILILWPNFTLDNIDDYMTYAYAIRFVPEYWHSVYTGCLYGACLMVFPHPFSISFFQWLGFISLMGYIYNRIDTSSVMPHRLKHIVVCFFILPFFIWLLQIHTDANYILCFPFSFLQLFFLTYLKKSKGILFSSFF